MFILFIIIMFGLNAFMIGMNVCQKNLAGSIWGAIGSISAFLILLERCVLCQ